MSGITKPRRGDRAEFSVAPTGLIHIVGLVPQGLRPWPLSVAPTGLGRARPSSNRLLPTAHCPLHTNRLPLPGAEADVEEHGAEARFYDESAVDALQAESQAGRA